MRSSLALFKLAKQLAHLSAESAQLVAVGGAQALEHATTSRCEPETLTATIVSVDLTSHQTGFNGTGDEFDDGVMLQLQEVRGIADRRVDVAGESPDRQQQLVLIRREPLVACGLLREPQEHAQRVPEPCERSVVLIGQHAFEITS